MLPPAVRIFVCTVPQDMRRSFDALALAVQQLLGQDLLRRDLAGAFAKVESQHFVDGTVNQDKGVTWVGGGLKYFVAESNFTIGLAYTRTVPRFDTSSAGVARPGLNRFTLQLQAFYC